MLLEVDRIHTFYGRSRILQGVSMKIEAGEIITLLGRNGVGKSTTLKSIIGLVPPKDGYIRFKGIEISGLKPHQIARQGVGYVPEERRIFPNLTVRQNLMIGMKSNEKVSNSWNIEKIYNYFPVLKERDRQSGGHLSGGEQQMLAIGRTLMGNPELLMVDEPTEGLAPQLVDMVNEMLLEIRAKGLSILIVEQAIDLVLGMADRAYVLSKGEIVFSGSSNDLYTDEKIRKKYLEV